MRRSTLAFLLLGALPLPALAEVRRGELDVNGYLCGL